VSADSPADVWAVGHTEDLQTGAWATLILHWNGTACAKVASPNQTGALSDTLFGVSADSATDAWAVGTACTAQQCSRSNTVILHWNGTAWSKS
jgi:hypothetical protein